MTHLLLPHVIVKMMKIKVFRIMRIAISGIMIAIVKTAFQKITMFTMMILKD